MISTKVTEAVGWYGAAAMIGAYGLLVAGVLSVSHPVYHVLNLTGGLGIMFDAYRQKNFQPVVLNLVAVAIAMAGLVRIYFF